MWNYMCIRWLINWSDSTKMHGATVRIKVALISRQNDRKSQFPDKFDWKSPIFFTKLSKCLGRDRKTDSFSVSGWAFIFNIGVFLDATPCNSAQTDEHSRVKLPFFTFSVTAARWFVSCYISTKRNGGTFKTIPVVVFTAFGNFSIILLFTFWNILVVFCW